MTPLFTAPDRAAAGPNLVQLAARDLEAAQAVLRKPGGVVRGLDVRELAGGETAHAAGPRAFATYCGALDAGLKQLPGLTNRGYVLRRSAVKR